MSWKGSSFKQGQKMRNGEYTYNRLHSLRMSKETQKLRDLKFEYSYVLLFVRVQKVPVEHIAPGYWLRTNPMTQLVNKTPSKKISTLEFTVQNRHGH